MYLDHYHLKAKPFDLSPGPRFLWLGEKHKEALAMLNYGIMEGLGFLLLTGDVGVGKTALIHRLIGNLDSSTIVAHITDPGLGTLDFFKLLAVEFNIDSGFNSKGGFLIELEKFLHQAYLDHKTVLLVVDEAQRLSSKLLDQIRVLSNIELSDRKLINIFFVGQPEFKNMLLADSSRAIRQRIAINYHIHPLNESETGQYIEHRLKVAGATRRIFKPNAMREIFRFTGGFPRAINVICDHALLTGYASGLHTIDADVIEECQQELNIRAGFDFSSTAFQPPTGTQRAGTRPAPPRRSAYRGAALLIGLCIVLGAVVSYYLLGPEPRRWTVKPSTPTEIAPSSHPHPATAGKEPSRLNEKIEKEPIQASSPTQFAMALPDRANGIRDTTAPTGEIPAPDAPPPTITAQAAPGPDPLPVQRALDDEIGEWFDAAAAVLEPLPGHGAGDGNATLPAKVEKSSAEPVAPADAEPDRQPDVAAREGQINPQDAPPVRSASTIPDRQPVVASAPGTPAPDPASPESGLESKLAVPAKTTKNAAMIASLPAARPGPQPDENPRVSEPVREISRQAKPEGRKPVENRVQPEKVPPESRVEPAVIASAGTAVQPSAEQVADVAPSVEQMDKHVLENRLRSFLQDYCGTYAAKNLSAFTHFFALDARENGQPFESLLPKYQRNFSLIEAIEYRIDLQQFSYDAAGAIVKIEGDFVLKWLPPDRTWRENAGKIFMSLKEDGPSFRVQRLDYHSTLAKSE